MTYTVYLDEYLISCKEKLWGSGASLDLESLVCKCILVRYTLFE